MVLKSLTFYQFDLGVTGHLEDLSWDWKEKRVLALWIRVVQMLMEALQLPKSCFLHTFISGGFLGKKPVVYANGCSSEQQGLMYDLRV